MKSDVGKPLARLLKSTTTLVKLNLEFNELSIQGIKWIAKGISMNRTLQSLNVKGNMIGDDGLILLTESLKEAYSLTHLDVSLNEIGPTGFQELCEVLSETKITSLICHKNFLGDDVIAYFANIVAEGSSGELKNFDFSSCRLNDSGLIFIINSLNNNKTIDSVKLNDNFFSEKVESVLLESLNKNISLTDISLSGNRLSHSCLEKLKKILLRNLKLIEEKEPNKLKAEIYRLRYERTKLEK